MELTALWIAGMSLGLILHCIRNLCRARYGNRVATLGHRWGDTTDEMFEAMREVDQLTPAVEPFLAARLPPRLTGYDPRVGAFTVVDCRPEELPTNLVGCYRKRAK